MTRRAAPAAAGLRAFLQIEQRILVESGNSQLASRDTFVGLESDLLGRMKMGNFDTVTRKSAIRCRFLACRAATSCRNSNVLSKQGLGNKAAGSFHLRRANSVRYESPTCQGLQGLLQCSHDDVRSGGRNAYLWSLGVVYDSGPLYGALAYELRNDTFGGSRNVPSALSNTSDRSGVRPSTGT
jgi:predicted porin